MELKKPLAIAAFQLLMFSVMLPFSAATIEVHNGHPRLVFRGNASGDIQGIGVLKERCQDQEYIDYGVCSNLENRWDALGPAEKFVMTNDIQYANIAKNKLLVMATGVESCGGSSSASSGVYSTFIGDAIAYDWIYNSLSASDRLAIENKLVSVANNLLSASNYNLDSACPPLYHRRTSLASALAVIALALDIHPDRQRILNAAEIYYRNVTVNAIDFAESWPEGYRYHGINRGFDQAMAALAWKSAVVNDDLFNPGNPQSDYMKQLGYWYIYSSKPDGTYANYYDQTEGVNNNWNYEYKRVIDPIAMFTKDPYISAFAQYIEDNFVGYYSDDNYKRFLLPGYDYTVPKSPLPELPKTRAFGLNSTGLVVMKEGWGQSDTYMTFEAGDYLGHHSLAGTEGTFTIFKNSKLIDNKGDYNSYGDAHHFNYFNRAVSKSTVLVCNPSERIANINDCGQRFLKENPVIKNLRSVDEWHSNQYSGAHLDTGDIRQFEPYYSTSGENYDYISADITRAYNSILYDDGNGAKVRLVNRQFAYLRPDYVVIFDRVESTNANFQKKILFQLYGKPATASETVKQGTANAGIIETSDDEFYSTNGQGRIFGKALLPKNKTLTKIGGPGYEWWVNGVNIASSRGSSSASYGTWRLEVSPGTASDFDNFLTVLYPTESTTASMPVTRLIEDAPGMYGASIDGTGGEHNWVVLFARKNSISSEFGFTVNTSTGTTNYLIADLNPSYSYAITSGSNSHTASTSSNGVLYFEDNTAGPHTVSIGGGQPLPHCSDGTPANECSASKPKYCNAALSLADNCSYCGCGAYYSCNAQGSCQSSLSNCPQGQITSACLCGGSPYSSGYCCNNVYQISQCTTVANCSQGQITFSCLCGGAAHSSGYCCNGVYNASACTIQPPICSYGQITSSCLCGGAQYSSGYCCNGVYNVSACTVPPANCSQGQITSACLCGGTQYSSGYCCNNAYSSSGCGSQPQPAACSEGATKPCGSSTGECEEGVQTCASGQWGACTGGKAASREICDNKDNDCDWGIDENLRCNCNEGTNRPCGSSSGTCIAGNQTCRSGEWSECTATGGVKEACDGIDNDCDGQIDEGCSIGSAANGPGSVSGSRGGSSANAAGDDYGWLVMAAIILALAAGIFFMLKYTGVIAIERVPKS